uniref:Uncharacterized protein MANES_15G048200 n=1 Tax=Rhizophora mucronata TaxID=61149 RepID=A0A2P2MCB6_RHIMU
MRLLHLCKKLNPEDSISMQGAPQIICHSIWLHLNQMLGDLVLLFLIRLMYQELLQWVISYALNWRRSHLFLML